MHSMYGFLIVLLIIGLVVVAALIAGFVLRGIGLYEIGKREGRSDSFMGFIPCLYIYFMGELSGPIAVRDKKIERPGLWLLIITVAYSAVSGAVNGIFGNAFATRIVQSISSYSGYGYGSWFAGTSIMAVIFLALIIGAVTTVVTAVINVMRAMINYQIYLRFTTVNMAVLHAVCGVFIPFYEAICLFTMRKKPYLTKSNIDPL